MDSSSPPRKGKGRFLMASEAADLRSNDALTKYLEESYTKPPPQLVELFQEVPHLTKLAELIHNLFQSSQEKPISRENSELCEKGICYLIHDYITMKENAAQANQSLGKAKKLVDYAALLAQNPTDITLAKLQILELQRDNQDYTNKIEELCKEIRIHQDENEKMFNEKNQLINELARQANQHKDEISKFKYEYNKLEDARQQASDQTKIDAEEISRLRKLLNDSRDETSNVNREVKELQEQLEAKTNRINQLRAELQKKDIEFEEFKIKKEKDQETLSTEFFTQSRIFEDKSNAATRKLARYIKNQAKQLDTLIETNRRATIVIQKQNDLLDRYEEELSNEKESNNNVNQQYLDVCDELEELRDEFNSTSTALGQSDTELNKLRSIVERSCNNLAPMFACTPDTLPDACHDLGSTRIDPETASVLRGLNSSCDALSRFIVDLLRTGKANLEFLKEKPIKFTSADKSDILHEVEQTRLFLEKCAYADASEEPAAKYLVDASSKFTFEDKDNVALSSVLAQILCRFREFLQNMVDKLGTVRKVLPAFDCTDYELPAAVADYINQLQPVFQQLLNVIATTLHYHGDVKDVFACLCKFIEESSFVIEYLDENIRPLINFNGKMTDLPAKLQEVLEEYKDITENVEMTTKKAYNDALIKFDKERCVLDRKIDDLNDTIVKKERMNISLQKQLEKLAAELQEANNTNEDLNIQHVEDTKANQVLTMKLQTSDETVERLIKERDRLELTIKERSESYEKRLTDALQKERNLMESSQEREKKRYVEQQKLLENQIKELSRKYEEAKANANQTAKLYNEQSVEHQKIMKKMQAEKLDLTSTLEQLQNEPLSNKLVEELQQKLADARVKNRELFAEIERMKTQKPQPKSVLLSPMPKSPQPMRERSSIIGGNSSVVSQNSAREKVAFVSQLGNLLSPFIGQEITWSRPRVIKTVQALLQRVELLEQTLDKKKQKSEWPQWAEETLKAALPKYKGGLTDPELRTQIADICIGCANRTKLIDMIQILRDEKKALIEKSHDQGNVSDEKSMKSFGLVGLFIALTRKQDPNESRSVITPPSPPAVKSQISMLK